MSDNWLSYHGKEVRPGTRKNLISHIRHAQSFFGNINVKDIRYGNLEDFLHSISLSDKSKHNILSTIHSFFVWMKKRREISKLPDFPEVSFELGYRRTVDKETQILILWWRRRESNPRPKIFHCSFYIHSLCFNFTLEISRRQDSSRAIPTGFSPFSLRESEISYPAFMTPCADSAGGIRRT
jgi:hypothetical protein